MTEGTSRVPRLDQIDAPPPTVLPDPLPPTPPPAPREPLNASTRELEQRQAAWFVERAKFERRRSPASESL